MYLIVCLILFQVQTWLQFSDYKRDSCGKQSVTVDDQWKTLQPKSSGRRGQESAYPSQQPLPVSTSGKFVSMQYKAAQM